MTFRQMFAPITFEEDHRGGFRTVTTVRAAARVLTVRWPDGQGPRYFEALRACLAALDGTGTEDVAREAFLAALREEEATAARLSNLGLRALCRAASPRSGRCHPDAPGAG